MIDIECLGPFIYAITRSLAVYKKAYNQAVEAYKNLTGKEFSENDMLTKMISVAIYGINGIVNEADKYSEISAEDFLKKYKEASLFISTIKKLLG